MFFRKILKIVNLRKYNLPIDSDGLQCAWKNHDILFKDLHVAKYLNILCENGCQ